MRARRRPRSVHFSVEPAEVLEVRTVLSATAIGSLASSALSSASVLSPAQASIVSHLAAAPNVNVSTVPAVNGDLNPYGVAFVPEGVALGGKLHPGDILVSNFNNSNNQQGTGTTIVEISPDGHQSLFFQGPTGLGLTTALTVLKNGFVLVGNLPTTDGTSATAQQGSLLVLNKNGRIVANLTSATKLDGPWDLTAYSQGNLAFVFVSNVLNGTVSRLDLFFSPFGNGVRVLSKTTIASGYIFHGDPNALEIGPTGLAFDPLHDLLYVASTGDNAIFSIPNALLRNTSAGVGKVVFNDPTHLHGPLGLVLLPDGNLIAANGDAVNPDPNHPSELVEFTPSGKFVGQVSIDPSPDGPFGIAVQVQGDDIVFAAVDDNTNTLKIWEFEG
jgi:hypothetical protein